MNLLNDKSLKWKRYTEGEDFDYPIDYSDDIFDVATLDEIQVIKGEYDDK